MNKIQQFPHCDFLILHRPNICEVCDFHPDWQELRELWNVNFTGEYEEHKSLCPSEQRRSLENINKWERNRPQ